MIEINSLISAKRWYADHDKAQYDTTKVHTYDTAAKMLTGREDFAVDLMEQIDKPGKTLEIAAGTGLISQEIQRIAPDATYVDREESALKILQQRLLGRAAVVQADFFSLPFADQSFDTVIGVGAYRYVPPEKKEEFWNEMHRITSPEGRIYIAQFYPRLFRLEGNDIRNEKNVPHFSLLDVRISKAKINLGPLALRSGLYRTFEFRHDFE